MQVGNTGSIRCLTAFDTACINQSIAWYCSHWGRDDAYWRSRLDEVIGHSPYVHAAVFVDDIMVCSGGIHPTVSLVNRFPHLEEIGHWLALIYTPPDARGKGYATALCRFLQDYAGQHHLQPFYLFTDSAASMYQKLGWVLVERLTAEQRTLAVMQYTFDAP